MPAEPWAPGEAALGGLPGELWLPLFRAFRRAVDQQPRTDLPVAVRPFAGWKPERLTADHPRRVLASALATDARLREAVAAQLAGEEEVARAATARVGDLVDRKGEALAAGLLAVTERWEDLAELGDEVRRQAAERRHDAEMADLRRELQAAGEARARLEGQLDSARTQRDQLRRRAAAAEGRAEAAGAELDDLRGEVERLRGEVRRLRKVLDSERDRAARKVRSAQARATRAEGRARIDAERARGLAGQLAALAEELRAALEPTSPPGAATGEPRAAGALPRTAPLARAGRPCRLPPGLSTGAPEGVLAILHCREVPLLLDGYNLTKHARGLPRGSLEQQRRWLVGIAGGVAARFGVRVTVAFDGADVGPSPATSVRGVQVAFSEPGETADDLIVALLDSGPPTQPLLVVTDDRGLRSRLLERDADVAGVESFLAAVGA